MFTKSAEFYDAIYSWKDYKAETDRLRTLIERRKQSSGTRLLDVACGTGAHLAFLKHEFEVEGLDLDGRMLEIARRRHPDVLFHRADMTTFDLGRQFDVVMCLFSSIGYARTDALLRQAIARMARHVAAGGLLIIEPWLSPDRFVRGHLGALFVDQPELKIARMQLSEAGDGTSIMLMHHLVGTPGGVEYFTERHEMGLFSDETYRAVLQECGLDVEYDAEGLMGRGLYIGKRSVENGR